MQEAAEPSRGHGMAAEGAGGADLGLGGRLPCAVCGYNLQGISILGVCPECGTAVRATILAVVDPLASELRPARAPRLTSLGLVLWSGAGLLAALAGWRVALQRLMAAWTEQPSAQPLWGGWGWVIAGLLAASGVGALLFVVPSARTEPGRNGRWMLAAGLAGVALYGLLAWLVVALHGAAARSGLTGGGELAEMWSPAPERTVLRASLCGVLIAILALLRPTARSLVKRSLVMRTGRVDRQTMLAMMAALGLVMVGDVIGLMGASRVAGADAFHLLAVVAMLAGGLLMTLGLAGALVDSLRIARAVLAPSPGLRQVVEGAEGGR
ncbi:MAG: hypothetical protein JNJ48_04640 [Phycisphaerae bacterium]|nr:hypothetical protein [Phycisphaerae bacterium]